MGLLAIEEHLELDKNLLDTFRKYMSAYCHDQAYCHFSPALIKNLEYYWNAAQGQKNNEL